MRRTFATSLAALGMLGGCDDGGGAAAGDSLAPTVTIKAPDPIEGGETVALSVAVTDNVDTGLTATLSCNGGTVIGSLLVTTPVAADTTIRCTATATDKAGNVGSAVVDVAVKATVATLALADGSGTFAAGQLGLLVAAGLPLTEPSYQATLDGAAITLTRNGAGFLVFAVPTDLAAGAHRIVAKVGARTYSFAVTTTAAAIIADPKTAVRDALTGARNAIDALIASDGATMTADVRAQFMGYSTQLAQGVAQLDAMSASDLNKLAVQLQANDVFQPGFQSSLALSGCEKAAGVATLKTLAWSVALVGGGIVAITPGGVTQLFGLALIASAYYKIDSTANAIVSAYNLCTTETGAQIEASNATQAARSSPGDYVTALAMTQRFGFKDNVAQNFTVKRTLAVDPAVAGSVNGAIATFIAASHTSVYAAAPGVARVEALPPEHSEPVPASEVTLGAISSPLVTGAKAGTGNTVTLTFKTDSVADANINFDFVLNRASGGPITVPAQLTLALPEADDAAIEATQGQAVSTTVHARGQSSLEIVTPPAHGAATLSSAGLLTYTPSGQYFGDDRITYRARNASGVSSTATVLISVLRKFEGYWDYRMVATVTSETQKYLCTRPDRDDAIFEINNGTFIVTRVSDTQYATSYRGFPETLSMASKYDSDGLKTAFTVNYTKELYPATETVNLTFSDSSHMSGSGTFLYKAGSNNSCQGTLTFTGAPAQ